MKKALILDFGGVISRTLFETHAMSERALKLPIGSMTWQGPFDPENDPLWQSMIADEISERDYWNIRTQEVSKLTGNKWTQMSDFVKAARGASPMEVIRPEFMHALEVVKKSGIKLAILSNELDLFYGSNFREKLEFLADFHTIVDATYTKILKPDPKAYLECLAELNLPAENCVFVDDQRRNILGAQAVGLQTVHFDVAHPKRGYTAALQLLNLSY